MNSSARRLVNYILSDECIRLLRPKLLKYIIPMLHNNFVDFYRLEQLKEVCFFAFVDLIFQPVFYFFKYLQPIPNIDVHLLVLIH